MSSRGATTRKTPSTRKTAARRKAGARKATDGKTASRQRARTHRASPRRRAQRRMRRAKVLRRVALSAAAVIVVALAAVLIPLGLAHEKPLAICISDPTTFPEAGVAGWQGEQLENAATIMQTATALGFGRDGQILGVMTAMGESSLNNIDYGDWETSGFTNPDGSRTTSIGLFQQQHWWGSAEQRMDPATAATLFYERLARVPDWQSMDPSLAIHRVQINLDPTYYTRYASDAAAVVDALSTPC
ncbi:MAG: hypothetical protein ACRDVF_03655 [Microbacterium sp.]|uniref:hypothetical protein n=1 Tax=unclassified Microbacterium TaxID=2609290 RepID=UPI0006F6ECFB|nr:MULTISPECIES: hypothetical protein [unclassified Microbacterium]KRD50809.1 hypothetical protein ASE34_14940 [Microbacterium sp. Root280D1]